MHETNIRAQRMKPIGLPSSCPSARAPGVSPSLAPLSYLSKDPSKSSTRPRAPPDGASPSPPGGPADVFRDVARDPLILLSAVGSISRRRGDWTEQGDLKLILTYWRYLLHPHREPINSLVIDGRLVRRRLGKLRKHPAVAMLLPKKAPASLAELGPALEDFFKLVDGGDVRTTAATIEKVEGTSTPDGAPRLNAGVASARPCGISPGCCGVARAPAATVASPRPFEGVGRRWATYVKDCDTDDLRFRVVTPDLPSAPAQRRSPGLDDPAVGAGVPVKDVARHARVPVRPKKSLPTPFQWLLPRRGFPPMRLEYDKATKLSVMEPHGNVPLGALIDYEARTARIAPRWPLSVTSAQLVFGETLPAMTYTIQDVARSTTVRDITRNVQNAFSYQIRSFADLRCAGGRAEVCAKAWRVLSGGGSWRLALPDVRGTYALVDPAADAESIDLFHRRDDVRFVAAAGVDHASDADRGRAPGEQPGAAAACTPLRAYICVRRVFRGWFVSLLVETGSRPARSQNIFGDKTGFQGS